MVPVRWMDSESYDNFYNQWNISSPSLLLIMCIIMLSCKASPNKQNKQPSIQCCSHLRSWPLFAGYNQQLLHINIHGRWILLLTANNHIVLPFNHCTEPYVDQYFDHSCTSIWEVDSTVKTGHSFHSWEYTHKSCHVHVFARSFTLGKNYM